MQRMEKKRVALFQTLCIRNCTHLIIKLNINMFTKTRYIHHLGRLYFKPLTSSLINESYKGVTSSKRHQTPEEMAISAIQSMHELGLLDDKFLTKKGQVVITEYLAVKNLYEQGVQQNTASSALDEELERIKEYKEIGIEIAKDCYSNGLSKGEIVKLDDIRNFINQNHSFNKQVVESGFLKQMTSYVDEGVIVSTQVEDTGIVFIHTDYASDYF